MLANTAELPRVPEFVLCSSNIVMIGYGRMFVEP